MSKLNPEITNDLVIPVISSEVFVDAPQETQFAIGMLAMGEEVLPGRESEFEGYLKLRANVYAHQTAMIPTETVREDGTEIDIDDSRSTHWAILERARDASGELDIPGLARVVGSIRTIEKSTDRPEPLPIEEFFPETFDGDPIPIGGVEVSRYIARHEDKWTQGWLSPALFKAVVGRVMSRGFGPTFGVVEEKVERRLANFGVPMERVAEPKYVPEYAADNLGFEVFVPQLAPVLGLGSPAEVAAFQAREREWDFSIVIPPQAEVVVPIPTDSAAELPA